MRGGAGSHRAGNAAEAYVYELLKKEAPYAVTLHLQQDGPADLVQLFESGQWCLYEVKSSKVRRRALSASLSPAEDKAFQALYPLRYKVIRVLRHPGDPTTFEVLSRGA